MQLEPGDRLLIFSDGVSESLDQSDKLFGSEGIMASLTAGATTQSTGEQLIQAVKRHAAGCDQNDDITAVCLGRPI